MPSVDNLKVWAALMVAALSAAMVVALAAGMETAKVAFPGSNGAIAFDDGTHVYRMNSDGSNQTNLTETLGVDLYPAYSPDGRQIAFSSSRITGDNPGGDEEIFRMSASGGEATQLTSNTSIDESPSWQPLP